jgi:rhodanese-related sulfurtransferase
MEILIGLTAAYLALIIFQKLTGPKVITVKGNEIDDMVKDKSVKRQFVDVRNVDEYNAHKVKGFRNIPLNVLSKRLKELDPDVPVVLMCASGARSMKAAQILSKAGYKKLVNVRGGISSYPRN